MRAWPLLALPAAMLALLGATRVPAISGGDDGAPADVHSVTAAPSVTARPGQMRLHAVVEALRVAGWPEDAIPEAVDVALCESGWDAEAVGDDGELGLFQVHPVHEHRFDRAGLQRDPRDPVHNASVALAIWRRYGWAPWTCQPGG